MWLNLGLILGLASALVAIGDDVAAHDKVAAGIWEHADIFQSGSETKKWRQTILMSDFCPLGMTQRLKMGKTIKQWTLIRWPVVHAYVRGSALMNICIEEGGTVHIDKLSLSI